MNFINIIVILFWNYYLTYSLNILPDNLINININVNNVSYNKINFYQEITLSANTFKILNLQLENKDENFGFVILQVHSHAYDITLSLNETIKIFQQNGTNLGYLLTKPTEFYIHNFNHYIDCNLAIIVIPYKNSSPLPGGCDLEEDLIQSPLLHLTYLKEMLVIDTPAAALSLIKDPKQELCNNITKMDLNYQPIYNYLPKNDFTKRTYFDSIKKLLEVNNSLVNSLKPFKHNPPGPANRRTYISTPGTGMIFNTIVKSLNGETAYVPIVTYSCQPWMWENGCTIIPDSALMKFLAYMLIIVGSIKIFVYFAAPYASLFLNCLPLGSYIVYRCIENLNISTDIQSTILVVSGLIFASFVTLFVLLCCRSLTFIFSFVSSCIFSWIIAVNLIYLFESHVWTTNDTLYQIIFWFSLLVVLAMTTQAFKSIWYIVNISIGAYSILVGLQIITKSNLLMVFIYHFNRISIENYGNADGLPGPDRNDIWLCVGIVGIFFLGIIFKKNKLIVYGRNPHTNYESINESTPIITRWTHGSDDVFESPNTNHNFFKRMARSPLWA